MQHNALHLHIVASDRVAGHIGNFGGSGRVRGLLNGGAENDGRENAGHEIDGPICRA